MGTISTIQIDDESASGYMDIGSMRMQWGRISSTTAANQAISFPVSFSAIPTISIAMSKQASANDAAGAFSANQVTATGFNANRENSIVNADQPFVNYLAIGFKPA